MLISANNNIGLVDMLCLSLSSRLWRNDCAVALTSLSVAGLSGPCRCNPSGLGVIQQDWLRHPSSLRHRAGADAASLAEFMTGKDETFVLAKSGDLRFRREV